MLKLSKEETFVLLEAAEAFTNADWGTDEYPMVEYKILQKVITKLWSHLTKIAPDLADCARDRVFGVDEYLDWLSDNSPFRQAGE